VIPAAILSAVDDAPNGATEWNNKCITRAHGWDLKEEVSRMNQSLADAYSPMRVRPYPNSDAWDGENRWEARVENSASGITFLAQEPSRGIDTLKIYTESVMRRKGRATAEAETLMRFQRAPEYVVWQLPQDLPLAVFVCCDGFYSAKALPTEEAIARCITDPEGYVRAKPAAVLQGTKMEFLDEDKVLGRAGSNLMETAKDFLMQKLTNQPSWQEAIIASHSAITALRAQHLGRVPPLLEDAQAAVAMATNVPVLLASDDNVSLELMLCV